MADWINIGQDLINANNIVRAKKIHANCLRLFMSDGTQLELVGNDVANVYNYIMNNRLKFLDADIPTRDFGG
jgi:hypothetical protein